MSRLCFLKFSTVLSTAGEDDGCLSQKVLFASRQIHQWIWAKYPTRVGDFFGSAALGVGYFEVSLVVYLVDKGGVGDFLG